MLGRQCGAKPLGLGRPGRVQLGQKAVCKGPQDLLLVCPFVGVLGQCDSRRLFRRLPRQLLVGDGPLQIGEVATHPGWVRAWKVR